MNKTFLSDHFVIKAYSKYNVYYLYVDNENLDNIKFINSEKIFNIYSITRFSLDKKTYKLLKDFIFDLKEKYKNEYKFKIKILSLKISSISKEYIGSCDGCSLQGIGGFNCGCCIEEKNDISIRNHYVKRNN